MINPDDIHKNIAALEPHFEAVFKEENRFLVGSFVGRFFEYAKWSDEIPFMAFPVKWRVKIVPPFRSTIVRFLIRTEKMPEEDAISVYLDCYNMLGIESQPYWEIYNGNDTQRFPMKDTKKLLAGISKMIEQLET